MEGDRKKEACVKLAGFEKSVGVKGLSEFMKCGGDFPPAFNAARAFCGSAGTATTAKPGTNTTAAGGGGGGHLCAAAKAQVRRWLRVACAHAGLGLGSIVAVVGCNTR